MQETGGELARRLQETEIEQIRRGVPPRPLPPRDVPTIPYTALAEAPPGSPIAAEWNFYRRIIGRLLAEGHEGKWLLIKNEEIVGIWGTEADANTVRLERFLREPVLQKQILA